MKSYVLATLCVIPSVLYCQPTWTEQPVLFTVGFSVGWTLESKTKPQRLILYTAIGKTAYDLGNGKRPDPWALSIGAWMGCSVRRDTRQKR